MSLRHCFVMKKLVQWKVKIMIVFPIPKRYHLIDSPLKKFDFLEKNLSFPLKRGLSVTNMASHNIFFYFCKILKLIVFMKFIQVLKNIFVFFYQSCVVVLSVLNDIEMIVTHIFILALFVIEGYFNWRYAYVFAIKYFFDFCSINGLFLMRKCILKMFRYVQSIGNGALQSGKSIQVIVVMVSASVVVFFEIGWECLEGFETKLTWIKIKLTWKRLVSFLHIVK